MEIDKQENQELWVEYLINLFQGDFAYIGLDEETGLPRLFSSPTCATCDHWHPLHHDGLNQIQVPQEVDHIEKGLHGEILKAVSLGDGEYDSYTVHEFYGWCKRYPPIHQDSYSIISIKSLVSLLSRRIPLKFADYQFPVISHKNKCGEWKKGDWVEDFIKEHKRSKQQS